MARTVATCLALALWLWRVGTVASIADASGSPPGEADSQPAGAHLSLPSSDDLLQQLSVSDWRQRRQSIDRIVQLGGDAEPLLRDLLLRKLQEEPRKNVEAALQRIEDNRLLGPSPITLHLKNASPREALAAISRQCSVSIQTSPDDLWEQGRWPMVTLDVDHRPFWEVMRDLGNRLGVHFLSDPREVRLTRAAGRVADVSVAGAFAVAMDASGFRNRLTVDLSVYGEPKITILRTIALELDRATDDQGNPLVPQVGRRGFAGARFGRGRRFGGGPSAGTRRLFLPFQLPAPDATHIGRFQGRITLVVQTRAETWRVPDPLGMSPATRLVDSIPVTLEGLTRRAAGDSYELQATIPDGWTSPAIQEEVLELIRNRLRVLDAAGHPLSLSGTDTQATSDGTEISAEFSRTPQGGGAKAGLPATLVWDVPADTRTLVVPFDFKDVPIPDLLN